MGVPTVEESASTGCLSPKIYQPPEDDMEDFMELPRKKKMYSSSSFYEEPNCIYPTVEEQVKLCRQIAESLSDDCNVKSKGANMFFKRVKKAEKWIVAESNGRDDESQDSNKDPAKMPYVRPSKGLPKLKLILDPRQIIDMQKLLKEGVEFVDHNAMSPEICHDIVKDLNSTTGKGAQIFARRKKKSEDWVVDENKVRNSFQERYHISYPFPESSVEPLVHPRVKALSDVNSLVVAESIIRAAEAKVMTYPNAVPQVPVIHSLDKVDSFDDKSFFRPQTPLQNTLKYSVPKGWAGSSTSSAMAQPKSTVQESPAVMESYLSTTRLPSSTSIRRTMSFNNFNSSPRAWNSQAQDHFRPMSIKPVRPPSVLLVQ